MRAGDSQKTNILDKQMTILCVYLRTRIYCVIMVPGRKLAAHLQREEQTAKARDN